MPIFVTEMSERLNTVTLKLVCPICKGSKKRKVDLDKYNSWCQGEYIQNVWPEMTADQREEMISCLCSTCWDKTFAGEG